MDILNENKSLTYLDSLPPEVLAKIVRVQPSLTCSEDSPFRVAAPLLFDTVEFEIGNENERTECDVVESTITISASDAASAILRVEQALSACRFSVKAIKICRYYPRVRGEDCTPIVSLVEKYCPNVESLMFGRQYSNICTWGRLVETYGPQLLSIEYCQIMVENLPRFNACTGILRLHCEFRLTDTLFSVLRSVGKTLEELCITHEGCTKPDDLLHAIQTHCRRLSVVSLPYSGKTLYTALLCSYGSQLIRADVEDLSLDNLRDVARVCTNLRTSFAFDLDWNETKWEYVNVIGPLVDDLHLEKYPCTGEESASAMARCVNLRRLCVESEDFIVSDEIMDNLFANSRFRALQDLEIIGLIPSKLNLQLIAKSTLNLRKLEFEKMRSIEDGDAFESVVRSNPLLAEVTIRECSWLQCERRAETALEILQSLLRVFSKCRKLRVYLNIADEDDMDENQLKHICRCMAYRKMNMMVRISNSVYEQNMDKPVKKVTYLY